MLKVWRTTLAGLTSLSDPPASLVSWRPAGFEAIDAGHAEDDLGFAVRDEVIESLTQVVSGWAEDEATVESDGGDFAVFENANIEQTWSPNRAQLLILTGR
jgi:hypothetical protein